MYSPRKKQQRHWNHNMWLPKTQKSVKFQNLECFWWGFLVVLSARPAGFVAGFVAAQIVSFMDSCVAGWVGLVTCWHCGWLAGFVASGLCDYLASSVAVWLNVFVTNLRADFVVAQLVICLSWLCGHQAAFVLAWLCVQAHWTANCLEKFQGRNYREYSSSADCCKGFFSIEAI